MIFFKKKILNENLKPNTLNVHKSFYFKCVQSYSKSTSLIKREPKGSSYVLDFDPELPWVTEAFMLTFPHGTSPHCTRSSSVLKRARSNSSVSSCCPGDTTFTTARYASSTAGDADKEASKAQPERMKSVDLNIVVLLLTFTCGSSKPWKWFRKCLSRTSEALLKWARLSYLF